MSYRLKFFITIIGLIIIVISGVYFISEGEIIATVPEFINKNNKVYGEKFKIAGRVTLANDIGLDYLYIDNDQKKAIFNLFDPKSEKFIKVLYLEEPKAELFMPNRDVIISGKYLDSKAIIINGDKHELKNFIESYGMQTKCESKYEQD